MLPLLLLLPSLLAAQAPPADAHSMPCPLDGLPQAQLHWTEAGQIWFSDWGDVLVAQDLGMALPGDMTKLECVGSRIAVTHFNDGRTFGMDQVELDLSTILATEAPQRSPAAKLAWCLQTGELDRAREVLAPLERSDPAVAALWQQLGAGAVEAGALDAAVGDLSDLPPKTPKLGATRADLARASTAAASAKLSEGAPEAALEALGPALAVAESPPRAWPREERHDSAVLHARVLGALGDWAGAQALLEPVVQSDPEHGPAWLQLGEAYWAQKQKKDARNAWLVATNLIPRTEVPGSVYKRCRKCGK